MQTGSATATTSPRTHFPHPSRPITLTPKSGEVVRLYYKLICWLAVKTFGSHVAEVSETSITAVIGASRAETRFAPRTGSAETYGDDVPRSHGPHRA